MTVYSGTFRPADPDSEVKFRDPLAEAREKLRQAARLPFHASKPEVWGRAFRELVRDARADVRHHIWLASEPESPLNQVEEAEPRLNYRVSVQRSEHDSFVAQFQELIDSVESPGPIDIWKMIELGECAILLEMALARHHNRLAELMYETTHTDVGVAG